MSETGTVASTIPDGRKAKSVTANSQSPNDNCQKIPIISEEIAEEILNIIDDILAICKTLITINLEITAIPADSFETIVRTVSLSLAEKVEHLDAIVKQERYPVSFLTDLARQMKGPGSL